MVRHATTLPLDQIYALMRQPTQPEIPLGIYGEETEKVRTAAVTSDWFRQVAGQLNQFASVKQKQDEAYAQRTIERSQGIVDTAQQQRQVRQAEQDNLGRAGQLQSRQAVLENRAREADNTLPADTPADEALIEEASGNGGFFSGLKDIGKGAFEMTRGAIGAAQKPIQELIETPFEVGRELVTGGGVEGVRRELAEGVAPLYEPAEAAFEIAREAIRGDLSGLVRELKEAGQEIPQADSLIRAWDGMNQIFLGEQKIITPLTRPIIRETLQAFQVPDGVAETIAKYAAEVLVPTTFIPIVGQLGKTKGAIKLMKAGLAEGAINMLQNRAGRKQRNEEEPGIIEDATMFTFGFGGRIGMEHAARALSKFVTARGGVKAAAKSIVGLGGDAPKVTDEVTVFHGAGGKLEGDLKSGSFVTTDRAAAQTYAGVDGRLRAVQGTPVEETVYEARVPRSALANAPEDATTLGSPLVLKSDVPMRVSAPEVAPVAKAADEAADVVPSRQPVTESVAKEEMLSLEHYSATKLDEIDPAFAGIGKAGAEVNIGGPRVSHFYLKGSKPERMVVNLPNKMTVEVPKSSVLDLASEEGVALSARAKALKTSGVAVNMGDVRQLAKNDGWRGIYNSTTDKLNRVQMFDTTKVLPDAQVTSFSRAVADTKTNRGVTVDPKTGDTIPNEGYFVGGGVPTKTIPMDEFGEESLNAFVKENAEVFEDGTVKLGTEVVDDAANKQVVNIDATIPIKGREEALELAQTRGEQRIWDTQANASIEVPGVEQVQKTLTTGEMVDAVPGRKKTKPPTKAIPGDDVTDKLADFTPAEKASVRTIVTATKKQLGSAAHSWVSQSKRIIQ